jgi:multidrug resistance efflux pump
MTVNIQNCSNVTVVGKRTSKNCKAVYNITTGEIYASCLDAADAIGATLASVSNALNGKTNKCKGMRLCFVSKMMEHLEEINQSNRDRIAKVAAYDADVAHRNAVAKAQEDVQKREEKVAELRRKLEEAEADLSSAKYDLQELKNNG